MRTATTKQAEGLAFEKLSSWSIVAGASKVLYKRYSTEVWIALACLEFAWILWDKLG